MDLLRLWPCAGDGTLMKVQITIKAEYDPDPDTFEADYEYSVNSLPEKQELKEWFDKINKELLLKCDK